MKKILLSTATVAALSLSALPTLAQDKAQGSGPSPYTECGIGAALFPETAWAAVTSNVIWDVGTTAVTSATMSPETCNAKNKVVAQYILDTYDNVVEETAVGEGEYVTAMLNIYGCDTASHSNIISSVRSDFGVQISNENYSSLSDIQKAESYYNSLNTVIEAQYKSSCAV